MDYESWFLNERGINAATLKHWNVVCSEDKAIFHYANSQKVRGTDANQERTFTSTGPIELYRLAEQLKSTCFIVEGESDTLKLWQEIQDQKLGGISVVGLSGINGWKESFAEQFKNVKNVIVILDNDPGYRERDKADLTYRSIRDSIGRGKVRRVRLDREGIKDICDFFKKYTWESFAILTTPDNHTFYKSLDLTKDPTPFEWLVDGLICQGDVTLMFGEAGIGKSWLSMALAIAIAEGKPTFLGEKLYSHGKVMYIDEENAEDVIYHRLNALGITNTGMSNIHYFHRQHIRLDSGIDNLLDDAFIISPKLIVVDSLTRVHNQDENNAGAMNGLFNEGIIPLARETKAAVLVLHHSNKSKDTESFQRIRGSSDIAAAIDTALDVRRKIVPTAVGKELKALNIVVSKSRRGPTDRAIIATVTDTLTGDVEVKRLKDGNF